MANGKQIEKWTRFWRLVTLWKSERIKWIRKELCICDCWKETLVSRWHLRHWDIKSCWCWHDNSRKTHWDRYTRFYKIWKAIKWRCNPKSFKSKDYKYYAWKWISVCKEWIDDYINFKNDMYKSYNDHVALYWENDTTIDRIDCSKWYYKDNCRWATYKEQYKNRDFILLKSK